MKRLAVVVLAATVALGVTGCGGETKPVETPSKAAEMTFSECSDREIERIKKERGTGFIKRYPDAAFHEIMDICKDFE